MRFPDSPISRRALAGLLLAATVPATPALAAPRVLRGTVFYRERMALPPTAMIEVALVDISLADAPSRTIARTRLSGRGIPARWTLRFDDRRIEPRNRYALQARITDRGQLLFINTTQHTVLASGPDDTEILVERVGGRDQPPPAAPSPVGSWRLTSLGGRDVPAAITTTIAIAADGKVSGRGGCNGFGGNATVRGRTIRFSRMASTMMACAPDAMDQEQRFLKALERVQRWSVERGGAPLILLDGRSRPVMALAPQ
uniref:META domain-containing protein n=1 Tax=Bosea sp. NBC_00436 TaxID=2969620 RepID=A0A9E8CSJ3_9HYPH